MSQNEIERSDVRGPVTMRYKVVLRHTRGIKSDSPSGYQTCERVFPTLQDAEDAANKMTEDQDEEEVIGLFDDRGRSIYCYAHRYELAQLQREREDAANADPIPF